MNKYIIGAAIILSVAYLQWESREESHGPGIIAPKTPVQWPVKSTDPDNVITQIGEYQLLRLAKFGVEARVLSRKTYWMDALSNLSPIDLALGWGPMSDEAVLKDIEISQRNRFFLWRVKQFPIPQKQIEMHASNMHLIPADDKVALMLKSIRVGQIVSLTGYLVEVRKADGSRWRSSMSRTDTGADACEIILVETVLAK